jgi:hypothetical protein
MRTPLSCTATFFQTKDGRPQCGCVLVRFRRGVLASVAEHVLGSSRRAVFLVRRESIKVWKQASCLLLVGTQSSLVRPRIRGLKQ